MESQKPPLFNYMLFVKICAAISKPWKVKHEINNEIGIFCQIFADFELLNSI